MALKNMIKLGDKVTFGRSGDTKKAGKVVKLNPKTAHIKCSNGEVMSVTYNLIQKPSKKKRVAKKKPTPLLSRDEIPGDPSFMTPADRAYYRRRLRAADARAAKKKNPTKKTKRGPFKIEQQGLSKWAIWEDMGDSWRYVTGSFDSQKEAADLVRSWGGGISRKKNPAPYKFGAASKKLRRTTKQDADFGDPAAFASTYPDEYASYPTREYDPHRTRRNPPKRNPYGSFARGGVPTKRPIPTNSHYYVLSASGTYIQPKPSMYHSYILGRFRTLKEADIRASEAQKELTRRGGHTLVAVAKGPTIPASNHFILPTDRSRWDLKKVRDFGHFGGTLP